MSKIHPALIIYPTAVMLGIIIGVALSFANQAVVQSRPAVTVTAVPEPTPTYHGPVLLDEVASQQGLPVEPIAHAVRTACAALDDGAEPVGVVLALLEDAAPIGPRAGDVAVEFGPRAYCPEHADAVAAAADSLRGA